MSLRSAAVSLTRCRSDLVAAASPTRTTAATTKIIARFMAPILKMIPDCQLVVEELYGAVLHTVLRSHDQQAVALDSPLEQRRPVSQVRNRSPDVCTRGLGGERRGILRDGGREQRLEIGRASCRERV